MPIRSAYYLRTVATLTSVGALAAVSVVLADVTYHVSPSGRDDGPGSPERPFRTITRARDAVRDSIADGMDEDATVAIHEGTYYLDGPVTFDERDSGRDGHEVVYRGAPGEAVRLVGGQPVTEWRDVGQGIYAFDLPGEWRPNWLMENREPAVMARTPNDEYASVVAASGDQEDPWLECAASDLPQRFDWDDAQVLVWAGYNEEWDGGKNYDWESSLLPIAGVDLAQRRISLEGRTIRTVHGENRYYVRGALELLDQPGEFHVDRSEGVLYYYPGRLPIGDQEIVAATTPRVVEVIGSSPETPVRDLAFADLTIELSQAPDVFDPMMYLACDGLIYVRNAERIRVQGCRLRNSGLAAVALDRGNRGHRITGNLIEDCAYSGVCARGHWIGGAPYDNEVDAYVNRGHLISNNYIHRCGLLIGQASGVWLYQSGDNEISHNLIQDMPRYGIRIDGTAFDVLAKPRGEGGIGGELFGRKVTFDNCLDFQYARNNRIVYNEVRDCVKDSQDAGGITVYGTGAGNVIAGNFVHHVRSSVIEGSHAGIYLDDAAVRFTVRDNIVARIAGSKFIYPLIIKGYDNVVSNNIIADNEAASAIYVLQTPHGGLDPEAGHGEEPVERLRFSRNILYRNDGLVYTVYPWKPTIVAESDHNIVYHPDAKHNCAVDWKWVTWEEWTGLVGGPYEEHTRLEDPQFVDAGNMDYRLRDGSPALELGFEPIDMSQTGLREDFPFRDEVGYGEYDW